MSAATTDRRASWGVRMEATDAGAAAGARLADGGDPSLAPGVSVILPTYQAEAVLPGCFETIWAQTYDGPLEVVIADGGSSDGTRAVAEAEREAGRDVRVVDNPERRQSFGLNLAARAARHPLLVRVDAQSRLPHDAIERMVREHETAVGLNVGGSQVAVPPDTDVGRAIAAVYNTWIGSGGAAYRVGTEPADVDTVYLGSWRRDELLSIGGWATDVGVNEDAELNVRWRRSGGRVRHLPEIRVAYVPRASLRALVEQYGRYGRSRARTSLRHREVGGRQLLGVVPTLAVLLLGASRGRPLLRLPALAYGAALASVAARVDEPPRIRARVPVVLAAMHLAWGLGFLSGVVAPDRPVPPPAG